MKQMKRMLSVLLALCLTLSLVPTSALAEELNAAASEGQIEYAVSDYTLLYDPEEKMIVGYTGKPIDLTIPAAIDSNLVQGIKAEAFRGCGSLVSLTVSGGVQSIGNNAFRACPNLSSITLQSGVTTIGERAFQDCAGMESVEIPSSVTSIGKYAFMYCKKLKSVEIPSGVTTLNISTFDGCKSLSEVTLHSGLKTIGNSVFYETALKDIVIPEGVTSLGNKSFYGCSNLEEVVLPGTLTEIGYETFEQTNLTEITLPRGLTSLGYSAFEGCTQLKSVVLPDNLEVIPPRAFENCIALTEITLPENLTAIGNNAFLGCSSLTEITLPESLTAIGDNAFLNCSNLRSLTISDTAATVASNAFSGADQLTSLVLSSSDSVHSLSADTFASYAGAMPKLNALYLPSNITDIALSDVPAGLTIYGGASSAAGAYVASKHLSFAFPAAPTVSPATGSRLVGERVELTASLPDSCPLTPQLHLVKKSGGAEAAVTCSTEYTDGWKVVHYSMTPEDGEGGEWKAYFDLPGYDVTVAADYYIDRKAPDQPVNFHAAGTVSGVALSWDRPAEADIAEIRVYCSESGDTEGTLLHTISGRTAVSWTDSSAASGTTYYYRLSFADALGQESEKAGPVSAAARPDTAAPYIRSISPANYATISGSAAGIQVLAEDDVAVASVTMEYSSDGSNWTTGATVNTAGLADFTLDTAGYTETGKVYVRFLLTDSAGNQALSGTTYEYTVDNTPPSKVDANAVTVTSGSSTLTLQWSTYEAPADFNRFALERLADGQWQTVNSSFTTLGLNLNGLIPNTEYTYRVRAYDRSGNSSVSDAFPAATLADTVAPVISTMLPHAGRFRGSIPLSFTVSDDCGIRSLTVQTSRDGIDWQDVAVVTASVTAARTNLSYRLDVTAYEDGELYVRGIALDRAGNTGNTGSDAPSIQYMIDNTAPDAPTGFQARAEAGAVYLTWVQDSTESQPSYSIYRSDSENGDYSRIASGLRVLAYTDRSVSSGRTYSYQLRCTDTVGNESDFSPAVSVALPTIEDTAAPVIHSVSPASGYTLGRDTAIRVSVSDNVSVKTLSYRYRSDDGADWSDWTALSVNAASSVLTLPTAAALNATSSLSLELNCTDSAGLESEKKTVSYRVDSVPPGAPTPAATPGPMSVTLRWDSSGDDDLAGYYIYRKTAGTDAAQYLNQRAAGQASYTYTDETVRADAAYSYYLVAFDRRGNSSQGEATAAVSPIDQDVVAPVVRVRSESTGTVNVEMQFSAAESYDNRGITGYDWDFGDNTAHSALREPAHAYSAAGTYQVTLTLRDAAGNESSGAFSVTVKEAVRSAYLEVLVVNEDDGSGVPGAGIYLNLGAEEPTVVYTDSAGVARVTAEEGDFEVGVYRNEFLPAKTRVRLLSGITQSITVSLVHKPIVTGELVVEKMTLEQIVAAGIDIDAPANQEVFQFEIKLSYAGVPVSMNVYTNSGGQLLKDPEPFTVVDGVNPSRTFVPFVYTGTGTESGNWNTGGRKPQEMPIIAVLELPGEASWLKDFFDVHLYIFNEAEPQFVLTDCTAKLNVPDGLTLVESNRTTADPVVVMGDDGRIPGRQSAVAEWILRGDEGNDYMLSADFDAVLADFNEPIHAVFETKEPFHVRQGDGLSLDVVVQGELPDHEDPQILIGLKNDDPDPYERVTLDLLKDAVVLEKYKTKGDTVITGDLNHLDSGEELWCRYELPRAAWEALTKNNDASLYLAEHLTEAVSALSLPVNTTVLQIGRWVNPYLPELMPKYLLNGMPCYEVPLYNDVRKTRLMLHTADPDRSWSVSGDGVNGMDLSFQEGDNLFYIAVAGADGEAPQINRVNFIRTENARNSEEVALFPLKYTPWYRDGGNSEAFLTIPWGIKLFEKGSTEYDTEKAIVAEALSQAAEVGQEKVESLLSDLGFRALVSAGYEASVFDVANPAVTFGYQNAELNGKTVTVICAVVRGTTDTEDILTDLASVADGFFTPAATTYAKLGSYTEGIQEQLADDRIFFIVGHSLGAAVANQMAKRLCDLEGIGRSRVYAYTVATPHTEPARALEKYWNIFNLINLNDAVTYEPGNYLTRYGVNHHFIPSEVGGDGRRLVENFTLLSDHVDLWDRASEGESFFRKLAGFLSRADVEHSGDLYLSYLLERPEKTEMETEPIRSIRITPDAGQVGLLTKDRNNIYQDSYIRSDDSVTASGTSAFSDQAGLHLIQTTDRDARLTVGGTENTPISVELRMDDTETATCTVKGVAGVLLASGESILADFGANMLDAQFRRNGGETPGDLESDSSGVLVYTMDQKNLMAFTGNAVLPDYPSGSAPWHGLSASAASVRFDNNLSILGSYSLADTADLTMLTLPATLREIHANAIFGSGISRLNIQSTPQLSPNALAGCENLTDVYYAGSPQEWVEHGGPDAGLAESTTIHFNLDGLFPEVSERRVENIDLYFPSMWAGYHSAQLPFTVDFDWFEADSDVYNHDLATLSIAFAMSAMENAKDNYLHSEGSDPARKFLGQMGFATSREDGFYDWGYLASDNGTDTNGTVAFVVSIRKLDGVDYVAVALRGAGYGGGGWAGDFDVGTGQYHSGFAKAAQNVYTRLYDYLIKNTDNLSEARIWVTGFSRSAATANLLCGMLSTQAGIPQKHIHAYTFATPNNKEAYLTNLYPYIYNLVNPIDLIPMVPFEDWDMDKYGTTYRLPHYQTLDNEKLLNAFFGTFASLSGGEYSARKNQEMLLRDHLTKMVTDAVDREDFAEHIQSPLTGALNQDYSKLNQLLAGATTVDSLKSDVDKMLEQKDIGAIVTRLWAISGKVTAVVAERKTQNPNDPVVKLLENVLNLIPAAIEELQTLRDMMVPPYSIGTLWDAIRLDKDLPNLQMVMLILDMIFNEHHVAGSKIFVQHTPETYLSWMWNISGKELTEGRTYRTLAAHCPVDMEIYDEAGALVGRTKEETVTFTDSETGAEVSVRVSTVDKTVTTIDMTVLGDSKYVILPDDQQYTVKLITNSNYEDGDTMRYEVTDYFGDTPVADIVYDSVPLTLNASITGEVAGFEEEITKNTLKPEGSAETLEPTSSTPNTSLLQISFSGGEGATGSMDTVTYVKNQPYLLPECDFSNPGYRFAGWEIGDDVYPASGAYTFPDAGECTVTALWEPLIYGDPEWIWAPDYSGATAVFPCLNGDDTKTLDAVVTSVRTEPSHTKDGSVVYTATVSFGGSTYTDSKTTVLSASGHSYGEPVWTWAADFAGAFATFTCADGDDTKTLDAVVTSVRTEPSHTKDGSVVYSATVSFGGSTYSDSKTTVLSASGHSYGEPVWTWAADFASASATFTCADGDDTKTLDAVVTSVRTEPSHTKDGSVVYTATVSFGGSTYSDSKTTVLSASGHSYGEPVWTWAADFAGASATFTCADGDDTKTLTADVTSVRTEPSHTDDGSVVYSATVSFGGVTYTDSKTTVLSASGHSYGEPVWTWAADFAGAFATFTCADGDDTKTLDAVVTSVRTEPSHTKDGSVVYSATVSFGGSTYSDSKTTVLSASGHSYGEPVWTWAADFAGAFATFTCADGDDTQTLTGTVTGVRTEPTATSAGSIVYTSVVTFNGQTYYEHRTVALEGVRPILSAKLRAGSTLEYEVQNLPEADVKLLIAGYTEEGQLLFAEIIHPVRQTDSVSVRTAKKYSLFLLDTGSSIPLCDKVELPA